MIGVAKRRILQPSGVFEASTADTLARFLNTRGITPGNGVELRLPANYMTHICRRLARAHEAQEPLALHVEYHFHSFIHQALPLRSSF